jgi:hypothetical protein
MGTPERGALLEAQTKLGQQVICIANHDIYHETDASDSVFCGTTDKVVTVSLDEERSPFLEIAWDNSITPYNDSFPPVNDYDKVRHRAQLRELPPAASQPH